MERKEPTMSGSGAGGNGSERDDYSSRRSTPNSEEPRHSRGAYVETSAPSTSPLAAIALVFALAGVGAAGYLGWALTETQASLLSAASRITQLESQLNITSTDSAASLGSLQVNIKTVDGDVKSLKELVRKHNADTNEKFNGVNRLIDASKKEISGLNNETNALKQDALSHKAGIEEAGARLDAQEKTIAEQRKRIQDVGSSVTAMLGQVKSAEGLAARITSAEEAIDAIDDNRRIINRDLTQIKQQLGIK